MSFGRNPHVAKAETEEQKARCAKDGSAWKLAWREAARQWERAADRETDGKRRQQYADKAEAARQSADEPHAVAPDATEGDGQGEGDAAEHKPSSLLN